MPDKKQVKLPTIEIPRAGDAQSIANSIAQIKEAIELMSGVRGGKAFFPTYADATLVQERLKTLDGNNPWETVYNQSFTAQNIFSVMDLGGYINLRGQLWLYIVSGVSTWPYARFYDAAGALIVSNNYLAEGNYVVESGSPPVPTGWSNGALDRTVVPLAYQNVLPIANVFGTFHDFSIIGFNKNVQSQWMSMQTYYNGTNIVKGSMWMRETTGAQRTGILFGVAGTSVIAGHLFLEGLKG